MGLIKDLFFKFILTVFLPYFSVYVSYLLTFVRGLRAGCANSRFSFACLQFFLYKHLFKVHNELLLKSP